VQSTRNAQIALTALSTYAKISAQRSLIFSRLAKDFLNLLTPSLLSTINTVSRKGKEREGTTSLPVARLKRLFYGERAITFQQGVTAVIISWNIKIDPLGFAGSDLSIATKFPSNCNYLFE
jgi:hypothetical protein